MLPLDSLDDIDARILEIKIRLLKLRLGKTTDVINSRDYESELKLRLDAANRITDLNMKNQAMAGIAIGASKSGIVVIVNNTLNQISDLNLRNQAAERCAINLARYSNTKIALKIVDMITDLNLKNQTLRKIAAGED